MRQFNVSLSAVSRLPADSKSLDKEKFLSWDAYHSVRQGAAPCTISCLQPQLPSRGSLAITLWLYLTTIECLCRISQLNL